MAQALLEVERLTKRFGGVVALEDVTLRVQQGETVGLIGPNGAGKTTLFNCVTGLLRAEQGAIRFGRRSPESLVGLSPHHIVQRGIARTFQNIRLFGSMSVLENVVLGTYQRTHTGLLGAVLSTREARQEQQWATERATELLEFLGLQDRAETPASSLPFGLQRRVEVARALAADPVLLLLDEPAAGLNPVEKQALLSLIQRIKTQGLTIVLIEHDMQVVMPISERVVVLDYGKTIAEGPPEAIQRNERVIEAYLGVPRRGEDVAR